MSSHEHPVAAPASPAGRGAISVIRCSGLGCIEMVSQVFRPAGAARAAPGNAGPTLAAAASHTMHHGYILSGSGEPVDEVMAAVLRAPASFTGEDSVEIFGHGSPSGVRRILGALYEAGFAPAAPGEFSRRAFLNGKLDLTRAEAINDLVNAQTVHAHRLALGRLSGAVQREVEAIRADLVKVAAGLAVQMDYPEDEADGGGIEPGIVSSCIERINSLADTYRHGRLVQEGVAVALAGATNAGKSSLFNALLRQERSIVTDLPGTTRDYVEATVDIEGIPARVFDTAGLRPEAARPGVDPVEAEGMRRSHTVIASADLVLYVVDSSQGYTREDRGRVEEIRQRVPVVLIWNKIDLDPGAAAPPGAVGVSALTGQGIPDLNRAVVAAVGEDSGEWATAGAQEAAIIDSDRQHHLLLRASEALVLTRDALESGVPVDAASVDLQDALNAIGEITGEVTSDEILDTMFGSFCLGK